MKYEKPIIVAQNELAEGIYTASGGVADSTGNILYCDSFYMNGVYHPPINSIQGNEYKRIERGCEGCPAAQGGECRLDLGPFASPLKPYWERQHHDPNETFIYWK